MKINTHLEKIALIAIVCLLSGCAHRLEIKNLNTYRNTSLISHKTKTRVGIVSDSYEMGEKWLVWEVADSLRKCNVWTTTSVLQDKDDLDYIAKITVHSDYKGSGWNFLINWPGFLVFAPAWHGYNYTIAHDVSVLLTDAKSGAKVDTFTVPIELVIRHADINRTWTEIGWFEVGIIPLIGGVFFIGYDDNVTPIAHEKAVPVISDFIAQKIARKLPN